MSVNGKNLYAREGTEGTICQLNPCVNINKTLIWTIEKNSSEKVHGDHILVFNINLILSVKSAKQLKRSKLKENRASMISQCVHVCMCVRLSSMKWLDTASNFANNSYIQTHRIQLTTDLSPLVSIDVVYTTNCDSVMMAVHFNHTHSDRFAVCKYMYATLFVGENTKGINTISHRSTVKIMIVLCFLFFCGALLMSLDSTSRAYSHTRTSYIRTRCLFVTLSVWSIYP